jgi:para-aminobenzoate synthetase/4-amino-4-deoxychorismate lyase
LKRSKTLVTNSFSPDAAADAPPRRFWQAGEPFVLLEFEGGAHLFRDPAEIVEARDPGAVQDALGRLEGRCAAGFLAYEAGLALERKLTPLRRAPAAESPPLLWFGLFEQAEPVDVEAWLPDPAGAWASSPVPSIARGDYEAAVERIRAHIHGGDIYQANFTFQAAVRTAGHPLAVYAALRKRARAGWGGVVFTGVHWILSLSPELFFTVQGGTVTARPMKGTAPADADPEVLRSDPKQRAENLMIVDLLRNDLSRVSRPGSVAVPQLFAVESYPTVQQMTSTVVAKLEPGIGPVDLLGATFPCGSVTGAPKIRAMELIASFERCPRGVYTGSIGRVAPDGEAAFNVAIRTLTLRAGESVAQMGLGSGIVADSRPGDEWDECLAKGAFVDTGRSFDLIETMRFDPEEGLVWLERHLSRIKGSAEALGFDFDRHSVRNELQAATFTLRQPRKVRLRLSRSGAIAIEVRPLPDHADEPVTATLAPLPVDPDDFRLRHKTSDRDFYDRARASHGTFEIVFFDPEGYVTEGSFTNVFVEREGQYWTPPLARGLLPGILRETLIESGEAVERELTRDDLQGEFLIGNAVRGLIAARLE